MHTANNILKWSFVVSGATVLVILAGVFATWLMIQLLVLLTGITA